MQQINFVKMSPAKPINQFDKGEELNFEEVNLQLPVELMNIYKETLPKIQSIRNHGFTGSAIYSVKPKPSLQIRGSPTVEDSNKKKF
jgi:hypothetical protein